MHYKNWQFKKMLYEHSSVFHNRSLTQWTRVRAAHHISRARLAHVGVAARENGGGAITVQTDHTQFIIIFSIVQTVSIITF